MQSAVGRIQTWPLSYPTDSISDIRIPFLLFVYEKFEELQAILFQLIGEKP